MVSTHDNSDIKFLPNKNGCRVGFEAGFYIHPDWNTFGFFNVPHLHNFLHKYRLIFNFDVRSFRNIN